MSCHRSSLCRPSSRLDVQRTHPWYVSELVRLSLSLSLRVSSSYLRCGHKIEKTSKVTKPTHTHKRPTLYTVTMISTYFDYFPFVLPNTTWQYVVTVLQVIMIITNGSNEISNPTPYSKFATTLNNKNKQGQAIKKEIPSKYGMLLIYVPSTILAFTFLIMMMYYGNGFFLMTLTPLLVFLHFFKRVLETLFVHRYSGSMDFNSAIMIGTFYSLVSLLIMSTAQVQTATATTGHVHWSQRIGLQLFLVGECGNFYHHYLLRQLRSSSSKGNDNDKNKKNDTTTTTTKRYVVPTGGLFEYVACPHYLFEIISFVGIAFVSQHLHALLVSLGMASYLCGRAINTLKFYQTTFDKMEWSQSQQHRDDNNKKKKAIVPFLL